MPSQLTNKALCVVDSEASPEQAAHGLQHSWLRVIGDVSVKALADLWGARRE
jgi:hypothetical protein